MEVRPGGLRPRRGCALIDAMITDMASYLRFFDSVRRRTERDVAALPPAAAASRPPARGGETGWSIGQIVAHIGGSRLYFASAYRGQGWIWGEADADPDDQRTWLPWLRRSAELRSVPLPGFLSVDDDTVTLLAAGFARGEPGKLAVPYARVDD